MIKRWIKNLFTRKQEKRKPVPYVEKFTKCDKCEFLFECKENGHLVECHSFMDSHEHYIVGLGSRCIKIEKKIKEMGLEENYDLSSDL